MNKLILFFYIGVPVSFIIIYAAIVAFHKSESCILDQDLVNDYLFTMANSKCRTWLDISTLWTMFKVLVIIMPFMSSALLLYIGLESSISKIDIIVISTVSMVFTIFSSSFDLSFHAKQYRDAFDAIRPAINDYIVNRDKNKLAKALNEAEKKSKNCFK